MTARIRCRTLSEAIRLDPDYANAYHRRGRARRALGDIGGSLVDIAEALRLDPNAVDESAEGIGTP